MQHKSLHRDCASRSSEAMTSAGFFLARHRALMTFAFATGKSPETQSDFPVLVLFSRL